LVCSFQEIDQSYVAHISATILSQGDNFHFHTVNPLLDPSRLTVAGLLIMQPLHRPLFLHLFERLAPTQGADGAIAAYKRAEKLAGIMQDVNANLKKRRLSAAEKLEELKKKWLQSPGMKPDSMGEQEWVTFQKQINPTAKANKQKKGRPKKSTAGAAKASVAVSAGTMSTPSPTNNDITTSSSSSSSSSSRDCISNGSMEWKASTGDGGGKVTRQLPPAAFSPKTLKFVEAVAGRKTAERKVRHLELGKSEAQKTQAQQQVRAESAGGCS
jgi:hypothetical protein